MPKKRKHASLNKQKKKGKKANTMKKEKEGGEKIPDLKTPEERCDWLKKVVNDKLKIDCPSPPDGETWSKENYVSAIRKASLQLHPDKNINCNDAADSAFKQLNECKSSDIKSSDIKYTDEEISEEFHKLINIPLSDMQTSVASMSSTDKQQLAAIMDIIFKMRKIESQFSGLKDDVIDFNFLNEILRNKENVNKTLPQLFVQFLEANNVKYIGEEKYNNPDYIAMIIYLYLELSMILFKVVISANNKYEQINIFLYNQKQDKVIYEGGGTTALDDINFSRESLTKGNVEELKLLKLIMLINAEKITSEKIATFALLFNSLNKSRYNPKTVGPLALQTVRKYMSSLRKIGVAAGGVAGAAKLAATASEMIAPILVTLNNYNPLLGAAKDVCVQGAPVMGGMFVMDPVCSAVTQWAWPAYGLAVTVVAATMISLGTSKHLEKAKADILAILKSSLAQKDRDELKKGEDDLRTLRGQHEKENSRVNKEAMIAGAETLLNILLGIPASRNMIDQAVLAIAGPSPPTELEKLRAKFLSLNAAGNILQNFNDEIMVEDVRNTIITGFDDIIEKEEKNEKFWESQKKANTALLKEYYSNYLINSVNYLQIYWMSSSLLYKLTKYNEQINLEKNFTEATTQVLSKVYFSQTLKAQKLTDADIPPELAKISIDADETIIHDAAETGATGNTGGQRGGNNVVEGYILQLKKTIKQTKDYYDNIKLLYVIKDDIGESCLYPLAKFSPQKRTTDECIEFNNSDFNKTPGYIDSTITNYLLELKNTEMLEGTSAGANIKNSHFLFVEIPPGLFNEFEIYNTYPKIIQGFNNEYSISYNANANNMTDTLKNKIKDICEKTKLNRDEIYEKFDTNFPIMQLAIISGQIYSYYSEITESINNRINELFIYRYEFLRANIFLKLFTNARKRNTITDINKYINNIQSRQSDLYVRYKENIQFIQYWCEFPAAAAASAAADDAAAARENAGAGVGLRGGHPNRALRRGGDTADASALADEGFYKYIFNTEWKLKFNIDNNNNIQLNNPSEPSESLKTAIFYTDYLKWIEEQDYLFYIKKDIKDVSDLLTNFNTNLKDISNSQKDESLKNEYIKSKVDDKSKILIADKVFFEEDASLDANKVKINAEIADYKITLEKGLNKKAPEFALSGTDISLTNIYNLFDQEDECTKTYLKDFADDNINFDNCTTGVFEVNLDKKLPVEIENSADIVSSAFIKFSKTFFILKESDDPASLSKVLRNTRDDIINIKQTFDFYDNKTSKSGKSYNEHLQRDESKLDRYYNTPINKELDPDNFDNKLADNIMGNIRYNLLIKYKSELDAINPPDNPFNRNDRSEREAAADAREASAMAREGKDLRLLYDAKSLTPELIELSQKEKLLPPYVNSYAMSKTKYKNNIKIIKDIENIKKLSADIDKIYIEINTIINKNDLRQSDFIDLMSKINEYYLKIDEYVLLLKYNFKIIINDANNAKHNSIVDLKTHINKIADTRVLVGAESATTKKNIVKTMFNTIADAEVVDNVSKINQKEAATKALKDAVPAIQKAFIEINQRRQAEIKEAKATIFSMVSSAAQGAATGGIMGALVGGAASYTIGLEKVNAVRRSSSTQMREIADASTLQTAFARGSAVDERIKGLDASTKPLFAILSKAKTALQSRGEPKTLKEEIIKKIKDTEITYDAKKTDKKKLIEALPRALTTLIDGKISDSALTNLYSTMSNLNDYKEVATEWKDHFKNPAVNITEFLQEKLDKYKIDEMADKETVLKKKQDELMEDKKYDPLTKDIEERQKKLVDTVAKGYELQFLNFLQKTSNDNKKDIQTWWGLINDKNKENLIGIIETSGDTDELRGEKLDDVYKTIYYDDKGVKRKEDKLNEELEKYITGEAVPRTPGIGGDAAIEALKSGCPHSNVENYTDSIKPVTRSQTGRRGGKKNKYNAKTKSKKGKGKGKGGTTIKHKNYNKYPLRSTYKKRLHSNNKTRK